MPLLLPGSVGVSDVWLAGRTCCPLLETGFDDEWSIPGVLRMEGLSALGLKSCWLCTADWSFGFGLFDPAAATDLAEKKATGSVELTAGGNCSPMLLER